MAVTVFDRIVKYCEENDRVLVTAEHRKKIGKKCRNKWVAYYKGDALPAQRISVTEPEGTFLVIEYPNKFIRHIDDVVQRYYEVTLPKRTAESHPIKIESPPAKKERKRIPIPKKPEKVFSSYK